jgi:hypothetical protein
MRCKQALSLILMIGCLTISSPRSIDAQAEDEIKVPKDMNFMLELLSPISTATNQKQDSFSCKVLAPEGYVGAVVGGYIRKLKRSGKANKRSEIDLAFDSIVLPDGRTGGFNAQIVEVYEVTNTGNDGRADTEGTVKAKSRVKVSIKRAVAGALIGGIIGGIVAGGQGAAIGAAIGAGVGVTSVLAIDGPDLEFKQGTQFKVLTNAPAARRGKDSKPPQRVEVPPVARTEQRSNAPTPQVSPTEVHTAGNTPIIPQPSTVPQTSTTTQTSTDASKPVSAPQTLTTTSQPLTVSPQPSRPAPPRSPSSRLRGYKGGSLFSLNVPANWRESSDTNPVTLAPEGGYIFYKDHLVLTHGIKVGSQPAQGSDLQQATDLYVRALLQANAHLQRQNASQKVILAGRDALHMLFSGESPVTGGIEVLAVYTTMLRNGDLLVVVTVAQQAQYREYEGPFQSAIRSLQITD